MSCSIYRTMIALKSHPPKSCIGFWPSRNGLKRAESLRLRIMCEGTYLRNRISHRPTDMSDGYLNSLLHVMS